MAVSEIKFIIEALLFTSDKPLRAREINTWLPEENLPDIKNALKELQAEYDAMDRSFVIKEVARGYQFRTKSEYAPFILQMLKTAPTRLSRAAMETLAIIAYEQPVLRQEIERLRGVDVGGILRTLMEKGLIRIMGRKNLPGRPLIYGTSKKFLEVFDLKDLKSLPKLKEIKDLGYEEQGSEGPVEKVIPDEEPKEQPKEQAEETSGEENSPDESKQDPPEI
ncbi:MAG: SMC-Scp complex subunit ScpB [Desulfobacterales bacterium]|nr:SMC-Scp complex subunit ScpB [Desulfobacterales bacterium]